METPKAYLHIQFIFEILANFFEFMRKKQVAAKLFCPRGQASNLPPPCGQTCFIGNPPPPALSTCFMNDPLIPK